MAVFLLSSEIGDISSGLGSVALLVFELDGDVMAFPGLGVRLNALPFVLTWRRGFPEPKREFSIPVSDKS